MKHLLLIFLGLSYFVFNLLQLNTINNDGVIQSRAVLENFVSKETADTINSIATNSFLKSYQDKLYLEADFDESKHITTSKEGFKKPYMFFLFLKDLLFTVLKIVALVVMIFLSYKLSISILKDKREKKRC